MDRSGTSFLIAPKDLQYEPFYERVLETLRDEQGRDGVTADRDLFEDNADYRRRYKQVYDGAAAIYAICRPDMSVGLGVFKQPRRADRRGIPRYVLVHDAQSLSPIEWFELRRTGLTRSDGLDHLFRSAVVHSLPCESQ